jgi:alanyl-tRNA synthetase
VVTEVPPADKEAMREARDLLRRELPDGAGMIATVLEGYLSVYTSVGASLEGQLPANEWQATALSIVGGRGGGKRDKAEGGSKDPSRLGEMLTAARAIALERTKRVGAEKQER